MLKRKQKEVDQKTGTTDVKMSEADRDSGNLCTHVGDNSDVKQEEEKALDCETRITDTNTDHSEITFQISISKQAGISDNIDQCNKMCTENSNDSVRKEQSKELSENPVSKLVCDNSESNECKTCTENSDDSVAKEESNPFIENPVSKPVCDNSESNECKKTCAENSNDSGAKEMSNAFIENSVSKPVCDNSESPECKKTCTENSDDSVAKEPSNAFIQNSVSKPVCDKSESPECKKMYTHTESSSDSVTKDPSNAFIYNAISNPVCDNSEWPECKNRCTENSSDSVAKEPSNAFIENPVSKPVCDNSESHECLEHMTEINNNLDPDREENTTVINTDEVNATEVTNEIGNKNIKQSDEEQKSHDLVNLLLCNDKNGNLDEEVDASEVPKNVEETKLNEVNFQMSDNNVQQSDAREVIIGITSSEEDKEQSRISMSVDEIINSLERSEPIDKYLDGDDSKKQVSENNQITESIMRRMDEFSESNAVDSME